MPKIYIKEYDTTVDFPDDADMAQVQEALKKQFPSKAKPDLAVGNLMGQLRAEFPEKAAFQPSSPMESKEFAPMVLGALGGAGGAISPIPGGAAIGGVLGYSAGRQFNRAIGLEPAAPDVISAAKQTITQDVPEGMAVESVGALGGMATRKLIGSGKTVTPEMFERMKLYEEAGVPYTAADIRQEKGLGLIESNLRRNLAAATEAQKFDIGKMKAVQQEAARVESKFGGKTGTLEAGQAAQESISNRYKSFMGIADKLYKSVPVDPSMPIETPKLRDTAIGYLDDLGKMGTGVKNVLNIAEGSTLPQTSTILSSTGSPYGGQVNKMPTYTWSQLNADRSTLRKMAESTSDMNKKRILYDLVSAINDDISTFANTNKVPEIKTALDKANSFYKKGSESIPGVTTFRAKEVWNALRSDKPEKIVTNFIKPNNASSISKLVSAAGEGGMKPIKAAWVSRMFEKGEGQAFSPARFASEFDKFEDATLKSFLSKDEIAGLRALSSLSKNVSAVEKMAGNVSGTAQQGMTAATLYSMARHPVLTSIELIGSKKFAEKYFGDKTFRNALIYGVKASPNSGAAATMAARLATMAGISYTEGDNAR